MKVDTRINLKYGIDLAVTVSAHRALLAESCASHGLTQCQRQ